MSICSADPCIWSTTRYADTRQWDRSMLYDRVFVSCSIDLSLPPLPSFRNSLDIPWQGRVSAPIWRLPLQDTPATLKPAMIRVSHHRFAKSAAVQTLSSIMVDEEKMLARLGAMRRQNAAVGKRDTGRTFTSDEVYPTMIHQNGEMAHSLGITVLLTVHGAWDVRSHIIP